MSFKKDLRSIPISKAFESHSLQQVILFLLILTLQSINR